MQLYVFKMCMSIKCIELSEKICIKKLIRLYFYSAYFGFFFKKEN